MSGRADRARELDDPAALRALAHPLRLRLLAALRLDGPATASMLGRRLGESSGATSFHLRTLARHGFVVDDDTLGTRRERWWRATDVATVWSLAAAEPGRAEAERNLTVHVARDDARRVRELVDEVDAFTPAWRDVGMVSDRWLRLTPDRLDALVDEVAQVLERYVADPSPEDAEDVERVMVVFDAFPHRGERP